MATIIGNSNNNSLYGTSSSDEIYGLEGNDTLSGEEGDDVLYGGGQVTTLTITQQAMVRTLLKIPDQTIVLRLPIPIPSDCKEFT